jgi:hypothetical protein
MGVEMFIDYDDQGKVTKINELNWLNIAHDVTFIDGHLYYLEDIGYVSQQITYLPIINCTLQKALTLSYAIAAALGQGPEGSGSNCVKSINAQIHNRFHVNFRDTKVERYDMIEFFNDGVQYVDEGGPQLSELGDLGNISAPLAARSITLSIVTLS